MTDPQFAQAKTWRIDAMMPGDELRIVMARMKVWTNGDKLGSRTIGSTVADHAMPNGEFGTRHRSWRDRNPYIGQ